MIVVSALGAIDNNQQSSVVKSSQGMEFDRFTGPHKREMLFFSYTATDPKVRVLGEEMTPYPSFRPVVNETASVWSIMELRLPNLFGALMRVPNLSAVKEYLQSFPSILEIIPSVISTIRSKFPTAQLSLDTYCDLESDDKYLAIYIRMREYPTTFLDDIHEISEELSEILSISDGFLLINSDFRAPLP